MFFSEHGGNGILGMMFFFGLGVLVHLCVRLWKEVVVSARGDNFCHRFFRQYFTQVVDAAIGVMINRIDGQQGPISCLRRR